MKYDKSINSWIALPNELVKHPVYNYSFDELYNGIQEEVLKGNIIEKEYGNLRKYHYHQTNIFTNGWNEFSTLCRGLILDIKNKSIVATPYPKFFNLFEIDKLSMIKYIGNSNRIVCKEKYDGSLGVIYYYDNKWKIDTKGAFNTEQAEHAQCWVDYYFNDESDHKINLPSNVKTILVEIIYPQNRIVVNYKHFDGIVFLSYYDINGYEHLEFPVNGVNNSSLEHLLIPDIKIISKLDILKLEETLNNDNENGEVMEG
ncbi:MAG: hypothetical protein M0R03_22575, partial [Novosphingobium sp.]|nr:hypothetical protein [Novosphingobium sp.]